MVLRKTSRCGRERAASRFTVSDCLNDEPRTPIYPLGMAGTVMGLRDLLCHYGNREPSVRCLDCSFSSSDIGNHNTGGHFYDTADDDPPFLAVHYDFMDERVLLLGQFFAALPNAWREKTSNRRHPRSLYLADLLLRLRHSRNLQFKFLNSAAHIPSKA